MRLGGPIGTVPPEMTGPGPAAAEESTAQLLRRAVQQSPLGRGVSKALSTPVLEVMLAALVAAACFVAGLPALHAYRVSGGPGLLVAAAALATVMAQIGARLLRLAPVFTFAASAVALGLLLLVAAGPHPQSVVTALTQGPNRVLTETLPLSGGRVLISPLVVLVWVAAAATSESLIRTARRRRAVPAALILPVGLYVLCYAAASSAPTRDRAAGPVLLVLVAVAASLRLQITTPTEEDHDSEVRPPSRFRAALIGVAAAGVAAAVLAALTPVVPGLQGQPAYLRRSLPTTAPVITDPVDTMGRLRDGDPRAQPIGELSVELSKGSPGYMGLAYLDDYDGGQWRFSATFRPTGGRIPGPVPAAAVIGNQIVTQHVVVTGRLPVPLLPAMDRPVAVSQLSTATDPATGMLLAQAAPAHPSYTVVSSVPTETLDQLAPADGIDQVLGAQDVAIPSGTAADLATTVRFVATLTGGVRPGQSLAFLQAVAEALQTKEKRVDPTRPVPATTPTTAPAKSAAKERPTTTTTTAGPISSSGTSLSEVINAVTVDRAATPEQFATFYAMVARYLGVPARVVTGFRLARSSSAPTVAAGDYTVTDRQAWAWVEIPVAGYGWVICDPTPDATTAAITAPPASVSAPATTIAPRQADAVPRNQITGGHPVAPPGHITVPHPNPTSPWVLAAIALAAVIALLTLAGPGQAAVRRAWRRRCRYSTDPHLLAVGAWLELLDGLDRAGMRSVPGATAAEVAGEVGHHFGSEYVERVAALARVADRAIFSTRTALMGEEASRAWADARDLRRRVMAGLDTRQRMRSSLLVGSAPVRPSGSRR